MKELKSIKLTKLDRVRLEERKMSHLVGGRTVFIPNEGDCNCGCYYANSGGSSTDANSKANLKAGGLTSYSTPIEWPMSIKITI